MDIYFEFSHKKYSNTKLFFIADSPFSLVDD